MLQSWWKSQLASQHQSSKVLLPLHYYYFFHSIGNTSCGFFFQSHHLLLRRNSPDNCKLSQTEQLEHGTREQVPSPKLVLKNPASIQSCILSPPHLFSLAERPFIRSTLLSLPSFPLRYNKAFGQLHFCGVSLSHLHLAKSSSTAGSPWLCCI